MADAASDAARTKHSATVRDATTLTTTFTWTLQGLSPASFTEAKPDDVWRSPEFRACGVCWALHIEPKKTRKDKDGAETTGVGLFLHLREPNCTLTLAGMSLSVTGGDERQLNSGRVFNTRPNQQSHWGFKNYLTHAQLTRPGRKIIAANGTMVVTAKLRAHTFGSAPLAPPPPPSLHSELAALLESGIGADVSIIVAGERLAAHSLVLALRSTTLNALLCGPLASAPPHVVNVPDDIKAETFKQLLRFLYHDEAPEFESHEIAQHLLHAADYYGVPRLRALCENELVFGLMPENAVTTLALAHALLRTELRASVLRFAAENVGAVMVTPEWSSLHVEHPELLDAVVHTMAHHHPPIVIPAAKPAATVTAATAGAPTRKRSGSELGD